MGDQGSSHECESKLHPTVDTRNKLDLLHVLANRVPPRSTKNLQNGVDKARHGLILRQHGDTAHTELFGSLFS